MAVPSGLNQEDKSKLVDESKRIRGQNAMYGAIFGGIRERRMKILTLVQQYQNKIIVLKDELKDLQETCPHIEREEILDEKFCIDCGKSL